MNIDKIKPGRMEGKNSEHRSGGGFIPKKLNNECWMWERGRGSLMALGLRLKSCCSQVKNRHRPGCSKA